jgi:hypothetical protein
MNLKHQHGVWTYNGIEITSDEAAYIGEGIKQGCNTPRKERFDSTEYAQARIETLKVEELTGEDRPTAWALHIYRCNAGHVHIGRPAYNDIKTFIAEYRSADYFRTGRTSGHRDRNRKRFFDELIQTEALCSVGAVYKCYQCLETYTAFECAFEDAAHVEHAHGRSEVLIESMHGITPSFYTVKVEAVEGLQNGLKQEMIEALAAGESVPSLLS